MKMSIFFSILEYRHLKNEEFLFASGDETVIRGWLIQTNNKQSLQYKLSGHFSPVTKIMFTDDDLHMIR